MPIRLTIWCLSILVARRILKGEITSNDILASIAIVVFCTLFSFRSVEIDPHGMQCGLSLPWDKHVRWRFGNYINWKQAEISTGSVTMFFSVFVGLKHINMINTSKYKRAIGLVIHYSRGKSKWGYGVDRIVSKYPVREGDIET